MENYNIYDEIGRGTHSFVYKARRKRSIEYVAVKSTAKSRMDKILNEVPFLHKLDSRYVVKFFDWYESSNHIWLILEYCMGGDLLNLITQDKQLPEAAVKSFGLELVAGLQYLHANSILYCDLKPANVLIDEFGSLKLSDFGLARRIPGSDAAPTRPLAPGSPHYMAPELFQQPAVHSFASDFWALGCVLYELRTGRQPFTHTNFSELARMIQTDTVVLPVPGYEMSPVFCNLLERLLVKDPYQRITWCVVHFGSARNELVDHPFWEGLAHLEKVVMPPQDIFDAAGPRPHRHLNASAESSASVSFGDRPPHQSEYQQGNDEDENSVAVTTSTVTPQSNGNFPTTTVTDEDGSTFPVSVDSSSEELVNGSSIQRRAHDEARPVSAPSSRTRTAASTNEGLDEEIAEIEGQHIESIPMDIDMRQRWRAANAPHSAPPAMSNAPRRRIQLHSLFDRDGVPGGGLRKVSKLIFTAADCRVKSIIGNKDIQIGNLPRIRADHLRFEPTSPQDLLSCTAEALESQLKEIYVSLKSSQADDTEKLSVMAYLFSLSCHARLAHVIVNSSILKLLIRMLAHESRLAPSNRVLLPMLCLVLGVLFRFATFIAPSSPDQLRQLVGTLLQVLNESSNGKISGEGSLESRPLALACLGELLFYISTQQEWELPMDGVEGVLACVNDPDIGVRYYAVRTLGNMLIHCTDILLPKLMSEEIVVTLTECLLQYAQASSGGENNWESSQTYLALRTTTTEALAQVLRHLRTPSSAANLPSRLKRSVLRQFAKPEVLNAVWLGAQNDKEAVDLAIASLNIVNAFLGIKVAADREAESAAIKASRELLLDRVVTFSSIQKMLLLKESASSGGDGEGGDVTTILGAKSLILLHLGMQLNRGFLQSFVQNDALKLVEQVLFPIADHLYEDDDKPGSVSPESKLSAFELYLSQCALNLCKLTIRMALKLGADCFSSHEHGDTDSADNNNNNAEHRSPKISPLPFELFNGLLRNPTCRLQLLNYFVANDSKQYTFFLRLMAKLLTAFPNEELNVSGDLDTTTVAVFVSRILLGLFEFSAREASDIVLVEKQVLFTHLLPAVVEHISPTEGATTDDLAVNCLKILHVVLLDFDYEDDNGEYDLYDRFIRSTLVPSVDSMVSGHGVKVESTWSLTSELLFCLISSDSSLLSEAKELRVMSTILGLLSASPKFHALPTHATQLLSVLVDSHNGQLDVLYESGIAESMVAGLVFSTRRKVLDSNLVDLLVVLLHLLHQQYGKMREQSKPSFPQGFDELVRCGPLMIHLCAGSERKVHGRLGDLSPEEDDVDSALSPRGTNRVEDKIADLASRCLVFLSQIFGEQLNEAVFLNKESALASDSVSSSLLLCLQANDLAVDGVVMLRVLLTLKNCLRSEGNNAHVSHWMIEDGRVLNVIKELASQEQNVRVENERSKSGQQPSGPSLGEQISRTSAAILRLCRS